MYFSHWRLGLVAFLAYASPAFGGPKPLRLVPPKCATELVALTDSVNEQGFSPAAGRLIRRQFELFSERVRELLGDVEMPDVTYVPVRREPGKLIDWVNTESWKIWTTLPDRMVARRNWRPAFVRAGHEVGHVVLTYALRQRFRDEALARVRNVEAQYQEFFADLFTGILHGDWNAISQSVEPDEPVIQEEMCYRRCDTLIPEHTERIFQAWYDGDVYQRVRYFMLQPAKNAVHLRGPDLPSLSLRARRELVRDLLEATLAALSESSNLEFIDPDAQNKTMIGHLLAHDVIR